MIETTSFILHDEYVNQFSRASAVISSIEDHINEISLGRFCMFNPSSYAKLLVDSKDQVPLRGPVPAKNMITHVIEKDFKTKNGLDLSSTTFYYGNIALSQYITLFPQTILHSMEIILDPKTFKEIMTHYSGSLEKLPASFYENGGILVHKTL